VLPGGTASNVVTLIARAECGAVGGDDHGEHLAGCGCSTPALTGLLAGRYVPVGRLEAVVGRVSCAAAPGRGMAFKRAPAWPVGSDR